MKNLKSKISVILAVIVIVGLSASLSLAVDIDNHAGSLAVASERLTEHEASYLSMLDYENVEKISRHLAESIGNRFTASFKADMTVQYLTDLFKDYGYEPYLHEFDLSAPNIFGSNNASRRYNHGYVEIGGRKYMFYGPTYAANTVYGFTDKTVEATGTVVLNWPSTGNNSQTFANLEVPTNADYTGKAVFVTVGTGPTQNAAAAVMPSAAQYHSASIALQNAGAEAVIFQWREPRATVISQLPPYNGNLTVGDTSYSRIGNTTAGVAINIPVGNTLWDETNEIVRGFGAGDETAVKVEMRTRSDGKNVVAVYPSVSGSRKNVYITSHFDTVVPAPGFNDSAIGVAMAMEMARAIRENNVQFEHNIVFIMFDAEETGLTGARYYVSDMPAEERDNFVGLYNMDMIATGQPECIYMFMNIPDTDIQEIQRTLGVEDRLIEHPGALEIAGRYDVFNHTYLAVQKLDNAGKHKDKKIVVDPAHYRYGDFIIKDHFNITWGSTTDNYPFAQAAMSATVAGYPQNMRNSMEFDWRILQRGLVGTNLAFTGMLETLYHKTGDTFAENYSRDRLEVQGDVVFLAVYHSAEAIEPGCNELGHNYALTVTATCWTGGWDIRVCSRCGGTEADVAGKPMTYGWRGGTGHDYDTVKTTIAGCWAGGGDYVKCKRCEYETIINWHNSLGHLYGKPQAIPGNSIWAIIYCERAGCGHSTYILDTRY